LEQKQGDLVLGIPSKGSWTCTYYCVYVWRKFWSL